MTRSSGSYSVAGIFMALFGLASAFLSPVRARFIDRYGLRRALPPMTSAYATLLAVIATLTWRGGAPNVVLWTLGVAAGACTPPLGPVMRTLWRDILDGDLLHRAYALDTVAEELLYVIGPLLVGVLTAVAHPALGVAVSAALVVAGALLLCASPVVQTREPARADSPMRPGVTLGSRWRETLATASGQGGLAGPVLVAAGIGACLGAVNLLVVAFAAGQHHVAAVAWVEASLSLGSVLGGLLYGARTWPAPSAVRLSLLAGALGVAIAVAGSASGIVALSLLMGVAGLFVSPALSTAYLAADQAASPARRTQAGAWVNTGFNLGGSGGAAGVGVLVARLPLLLSFLIAGGFAVLGAAVPPAGKGTGCSRSAVSRRRR